MMANDIALSYLFDENRSQASIMVRAADGQVLSAYISGKDVPALYEALTQLEARAQRAETERDDAIARAEAAENALRELEAETRWREVAEEPEREGQYQTYCGYGYYDLHLWFNGRWYDGSYGRTPTHWRPLRPPPVPPRPSPAHVASSKPPATPPE